MDRAGIVSFVLITLVTCTRLNVSHAADQMLNIYIVGDGTVFVMPQNPPGLPLDCRAASCGFSFATGATIMVAPDPGPTSTLIGLTGDCSGPFSFLTMDGTKSCTATFGAINYFKLIGLPDRYFVTLNNAYDAVATGTSARVLSTGFVFQENILLNRDVALTLSGGYNADFTAASGATTLEGLVQISRGSLIAENLVISAPALKVTASTPKNNETYVPSGTQITVSITNKLNPAVGTVTLIGENQFGKSRVTGSLSYDSTADTINFNHGGLQSNTTYTLAFSGLQDTAGNTLRNVTLTFKTKNYQVQHSIRYNKNNIQFDCVNFTQGTGSYTFSRSTAGLGGTCSPYGGNSPFLVDNYLLNQASGISSQNHSTLIGGQILSATHSYNSSNYRTQTVFTRIINAAPVTVGYSNYSYDARGYLTRITRYNGPGPDQSWFTGDDTVASYQSEIYDSQSIKIKSVFYSAAGADGLWFTSDDKLESYQTYARDNDGFPVRRVVYSAAGADGVWQTADDVVESYWQTSYGSNYLKDGSIHYGAAGADGLWFTADDQVIRYDLFQYDTGLNPTWEFGCDGPGPDGIWFNGDDTVMKSNEYAWVL